MKELSIEQKARAYDKAIEKIKYVMEHGVSPVLNKEDLQDIFPELKESKDDRIRKAIKQMYSFLPNKPEYIGSVSVKDILYWLEKQGNTNETIDRDEFAQSVLRGAAINLITWIDYNAAEGNMCLSNVQCKEIENALVRGDWNKIYAYMKKKLERQDEQKSIFDFNANNWYASKVDGKIHNIYNSGVESKFHEGDWVVYKNEVCQIVKREEGCNKLVTVFGIEKELVNERNLSTAHLWTIQDAKDGDVLLFEGYYNSIVLFQGIGINGKGRINYHCKCDLGNYSFGIQGDVACLGTIEKDAEHYHPATKGQRDLLFKKMKENNWEWDEDKKELKKIEEEYNGEDYGIDSLFHAQRILESTLGEVKGYQTDDGILEHKCAITAVRKLAKVEWSEEDENTVQAIIYAVRDSGCNQRIGVTNEKMCTWLMSLKERMK